MKIDLSRWAAGALVAGSIGATAVQAQDANYQYMHPVSLDGAAVAAPAEEINLAPNIGAQLTGCSDGDCGVPTCSDCCSREGIIGGAEVLIMKPYADGLLSGVVDVVGQAAGLGSALASPLNYNAGFRFWTGYQFSDGLSVRARFFNFSESGSSNTGTGIDVQQRVTYFNTDLEVGDTFILNDKWSVYAGAGLRYADYRHRFGLTAAPGGPLGGGGAGNIDIDYYGIGPIASAELHRTLNSWISLYGNFRGGVLVGNYNGSLNIAGTGPLGALNLDASGVTLETQIGVQAQRKYGRGLAYGRVGWESQYLGVSALENPAFQGGVFSLGYVR